MILPIQNAITLFQSNRPHHYVQYIVSRDNMYIPIQLYIGELDGHVVAKSRSDK